MKKRVKDLEIQQGRFFQQYARKRCPGIDPNDRSYDRRVERLIKKLSPEELDRLLNGEPASQMLRRQEKK